MRLHENTKAMREITSHKVNALNEAISVTALDDPGPGGASHLYKIALEDGKGSCYISFQNGPIPEAGFNGITGEALLAVVEDRLRGFQKGPFRCRKNALALAHLQQARMWLQERTRDRMRRGVEGTHEL